MIEFRKDYSNGVKLDLSLIVSGNDIFVGKTFRLRKMALFFAYEKRKIVTKNCKVDECYLTALFCCRSKVRYPRISAQC